MSDISRIRKRMTELGLTEPILAKELMMSETKMKQYMDNPVLIDRNIEEFSKVLLCSSEYLKGETEEIGDNTDTGSRIRKLRYEHHISSEDLAGKIGLSSFLMKNMENGKAAFHDKLREIAVYFKKDPDYFEENGTAKETAPTVLPVQKIEPKKTVRDTEVEEKDPSDNKEDVPANKYNHPMKIRVSSEGEDIDGKDTGIKEKENDNMETEKDVYSEQEQELKEETDDFALPAPVKEMDDDKENGPGNTEIDYSPASIGKRIQDAREAKGYSAAELARICGVSSSMLRSIETGKGNPRADVFARIAVECGISPYTAVCGLKENGISAKEREAEESLGSYLKMLREMKGWKFSDLAKASGVSASAVSKLEYTSDTNLEILLKLADALKCNPGTLMLYVTPAAKKTDAEENAKKKASRPAKKTHGTASSGNLDTDELTVSADRILEEISRWKEMLKEISLSTEEKDLIMKYRQLSDIYRAELEHSLDFLLNAQKKA